jgi:predicted Zn-dependent peptidase
MNPEHLSKVMELVKDEVRLLVRDGIAEDDLAKSKEQLKGNYILGLESTSSRMNSIGKSELMLGYINSPEEVLEKIERINMEHVREVIEKVFDMDSVGLSAVGNLKKDIDFRKLF